MALIYFSRHPPLALLLTMAQPRPEKQKQTNELRKITHVLTADARQAEIYQKQEEQFTKISSAAALLAGNDDGGNGSTSTGSDADSASIAAANRSTASLRGAAGNKAGVLRLYRPNAGRANAPDRELQEWAAQLPAEDQDSGGKSRSQVRMYDGRGAEEKENYVRRTN